MKLDPAYFEHDDVVFMAKDLLGKVLVTHWDGALTSGIITETEAYAGRNDKACHAHGGKLTPRNRIMYGPGGYAYVYLCYGIHHLFNIVTNVEGLADAVLIRAIQPWEGEETMVLRRKKPIQSHGFAGGPGTLTQALGIRVEHSGLPLWGEHVWLEDRKIKPKDSEIKITPRIGVGYAGEDALLPWRFVWGGR